MRTIVTILLVLTSLFFAPKLVDRLILSRQRLTSVEVVNKAYQDGKGMPPIAGLPLSDGFKLSDSTKTLVLEAKNTITLRGPVTSASVAKMMLELRKMSKNLPSTTPIYLVLDTPGGSIFDGLDLIDFAKALPQKVHTVTLFAASMGFQIAQNLDTRYISPAGLLMSHRAYVDGLGGQIKGELESRYKMLRRAVDYLDFQAAQRMKMDLKAYEAMVINEYWVYGYDAVADKAADEEINLRCGSSLDGVDTMEFSTLFGPVTVEFSKCPLIKAPLKIDFSKTEKDERGYLETVFDLAFQDKPKFVRDYITTNRFSQVFR